MPVRYIRTILYRKVGQIETSFSNHDNIPPVNPLAGKRAEAALRTSPIFQDEGQVASLGDMIRNTHDDTKSILAIAQNARKKLRGNLQHVTEVAKTEMEAEISENFFCEMRGIEFELLKGNRYCIQSSKRVVITVNNFTKLRYTRTRKCNFFGGEV